jgi:hypothetical protein
MEARDILAEKASEMAVLDSQLAPAREEERRVREAILATHKRSGDVVILNLARAGERVPLFEQLTAISREWGPLKAQRSRLNAEIKNIERQIERLQKQIETENRKKRRG